MNTTSCVRRGCAKIVIGAILACWLVAAGTAEAQWSENWDSYANGSQAIGQGGWQGWDGVATVGGLVTDNQAFSGPNSVQIFGTALTPGNYSDLVHQYTGYTSGQWLFSARQFVPSGATGTSYFILLDHYADNSTTNNWAIQTAFNLTAGTLTEQQGETSATLPVVRNQWIELQYQINLTANTVSSFYNGTLISTHPWAAGDNALNQIQAIDLYSDISGPVFYDSLSLTQVPEPTLFGLLATFGATFMVWRRRSAQS